MIYEVFSMYNDLWKVKAMEPNLMLNLLDYHPHLKWPQISIRNWNDNNSKQLGFNLNPTQFGLEIKNGWIYSGKRFGMV